MLVGRMTHGGFQGARVTVMGLGRFGGGLGVTRWLVDQGAAVTVTDLEPAARLAEPVAALREAVAHGRVRLVLGEHREADFRDADVVVANPAVPRPWENRFVRAAMDAGVAVTTEIRLTCERLDRSRVIGVTGSAGKSTTSAMIAHAMRRLRGACRLGGNIGGSLLAETGAIGAGEWVVMELSSAQLHWLGAAVGFAGAAAWTPAVSVVTSFAPNHIDWHGSLEHYRASKANLVRGEGVVVFADGALAREFPTARRAAIGPEGPRPVLRIPGAHNRRNALVAAAAVGEAIGASAEETLEALRDFPGLAHRLELVGEWRGVRVFNDSKSTTPESSALALRAFEEEEEGGERRVHLICGGYDKKVDLGPMVGPAARCAGVWCVGATGPVLASAIAAAGGRAVVVETVEAATRAACVEAAGRGELGGTGGGVVLLSPGCASWDQFTNFEERGSVFCDAARAALGGG